MVTPAGAEGQPAGAAREADRDRPVADGVGDLDGAGRDQHDRGATLVAADHAAADLELDHGGGGFVDGERWEAEAEAQHALEERNAWIHAELGRQRGREAVGGVDVVQREHLGHFGKHPVAEVLGARRIHRPVEVELLQVGDRVVEQFRDVVEPERPALDGATNDHPVGEHDLGAWWRRRVDEGDGDASQVDPRVVVDEVRGDEKGEEVLGQLAHHLRLEHRGERAAVDRLAQRVQRVDQVADGLDGVEELAEVVEVAVGQVGHGLHDRADRPDGRLEVPRHDDRGVPAEIGEQLLPPVGAVRRADERFEGALQLAQHRGEDVVGHEKPGFV